MAGLLSASRDAPRSLAAGRGRADFFAGGHQHLLVVSGAAAHKPLESAGKAAVIAVFQGFGNLKDGKVLLQQQFLGLFDLALQDELPHGDAGVFFEQGGKVAFAQIDAGGHVLHPQAGKHVVADVALCLLNDLGDLVAPLFPQGGGGFQQPVLEELPQLRHRGAVFQLFVGDLAD